MHPAVVYVGMSAALLALSSAGPSAMACKYSMHTRVSARNPFAVGTSGCQGAAECQFKTLLEAQGFCNNVASCTAILHHPALGDCLGGHGCFTPREGTVSNDVAWSNAGGKTYMKQCSQSSQSYGWNDVGHGDCRDANGKWPDYLHTPGSTEVPIDQCKHLCEQSPGCMAISYTANVARGWAKPHQCGLWGKGQNVLDDRFKAYPGNGGFNEIVKSSGGGDTMTRCYVKSKVKHTDGACKGIYLGGASGIKPSVEACKNSCSNTDRCAFFAFCPSGTSGCTGPHENKCALYSTCTSKDSSKGYTTYTARYTLAGRTTLDQCPVGSSAIKVQAACESAASSFGKPFATVYQKSYPEGCYLGAAGVAGQPVATVFLNTHATPDNSDDEKKCFGCRYIPYLPMRRTCEYMKGCGRRLAVYNPTPWTHWAPICEAQVGGRRLVQEVEEAFPKAVNSDLILV